MTVKTIPSSLQSELSDLYRGMDWGSTSLGPYEQWPDTLKVLINSILMCPIPQYITWGSDHVFLYNQAYIPLLSRKHPNALGQPFAQVWPEVWPQLEPLFVGALSGKTWYFEDNLMMLDRHEFTEKGYFTFSLSPIINEIGIACGVFCVCYETTAVVQTQERLDEEKRKFEIIFENAASAMALVREPQHYFEKANPAFHQLFRGRPVIGRHFLEVFPEFQESHYLQMLDHVYSTGVPFKTLGERIEWIDAETGVLTAHFLNLSFTQLLHNGQVQGVLIDIADMTQRVLAQNELSLAREAAESANTAKSAFLANMSHEIRSPLGAIMGFVELLRDPDIDRDDVSQYLGVIERNSHQLLRIIDDILDLSKVEAGKMLIEWIDFSLLELLSDFSSLMGFKARENGIDFVLRAATHLPDFVSCDPTRLRQILTNVIGNAIKFTHKGQVILTVSFLEGRLEFHVEDTGVGISESEASRLFQAFGQADASTTRKFGGTGLGLVLTKRLSQALGGDFWLKSSKVGQGSTFVAYVRVESPQYSQLIHSSRFQFTTRPQVSAVALDPTFLDLKILVVEDSPDNQMLLEVILRKHGARVELAANGSIGVEKALLGNFDLVLMDVQMPEMDGYEAVRFLRDRHFDRPIIALTAHAMVEEREKCLTAGYSDFLSKPIDRVKLIEAIKSQMGLR
ncbi:MAG: response regulator [Proteobacteria bacterium]|nr:MAG: response regulator [Pseudomonadota bacterium]